MNQSDELQKRIAESLPRWMVEQPQVQEHLAMAVLKAMPLSPVTYEQFLAWADEDTLAEWVKGEIVMTSPASFRHQDITDFLLSVMRPVIEQQKAGRLISAPFQMRLAESGREPDLLFVAENHRERIRDTYLDGPADLVVEIISPESVGRDRGQKFYEYEQAGIPEYWLIDPLRKRAEFYQLDGEGWYQSASVDADGRYRTPLLPGFWLQLDWLWQEPLPAVLDVLRQLEAI